LRSEKGPRRALGRSDRIGAATQSVRIQKLPEAS
jgi:hypothetical protein